jgi:hypothetical protein
MKDFREKGKRFHARKRLHRDDIKRPRKFKATLWMIV